MAHVTASVNRLYETGLLTAGSSPKRGIAPPNAKTDAPSSDSGTGDFQTLFGNTASKSSPAAATSTTTATTPSLSTQAAAPATEAESVPTPESVFGGSPWLANPVGTNPDGSQFSYNPWYFATPQAATQVAQMLGGTVVSQNEFTSPGSPFVQQQPNLMVQMPDGRLINAGLVASFYAHGYPQSYINTLISNEINGSGTI
jgi:hypothetical protein